MALIELPIMIRTRPDEMGTSASISKQKKKQKKMKDSSMGGSSPGNYTHFMEQF